MIIDDNKCNEEKNHGLESYSRIVSYTWTPKSIYFWSLFLF